MLNMSLFKSITLAAIVGAGFLLVGCAESPKSAVQLNSNFTMGGYAYYDNGNDSNGNPNFLVKDTAVADVVVSVTSPDGSEDSATSDATGYYEISGLKSGAYTFSVTKTGYDTGDGVFDVTSIDDFVSVNHEMGETQFTATVLANTLEDGDSLTAGLEGVAAKYTATTDTTIVVTLNQAGGDTINGFASASLFDGSTTINATLDSTRTILTFSESDINTLATQGATETVGGVTLSVNAQRITPIHGYSQNFGADVDILLVP